MAGFAIDIGDEGAAFEKGVNMPSASSGAAVAAGLSAIGSGVFKTLDAMDAAKRASAPTESQVNRSAFAALSKAIDDAKGAKPLQARAVVNSAIAEYNNLGFDIGEAEARMIKQRTGIDVDFINFNPQQEAINNTIEKISANPAYLYNARATLETAGKPYTDNDVLALAMSDVQRNEAAALYLVNAKNITRQEFLETYVPNANQTLENLRGQALAGLDIEMGGGNITPETVVKLRTQFDIAKAQLTKPPLVPAEDWQVVQSQIDTLSDLLTSLESYDDRTLAAMKADIVNHNSEVLMKLAKEKIKDPILSNALLSDKFDPTGIVVDKYPELRKLLSELEGSDIVYTPLDTLNVDTPEAAEVTTEELPPVEPITSNLHDPEQVELAEERSNRKRKGSIEIAVSTRINSVTPEMMNQPEHRDNFLAGVGLATVNVATSGKLIDPETMYLVYNDDTYTKLKIIDGLDPEAAKLARNRLIDGLKAQANVYSTAASGTLQNSYFDITGAGKIEFNLERRTMQGAFRMGETARDLATGLASKHYNGNITAMIADRGRRLTTFERSNLEKEGFNITSEFQAYREIKKLSDGMKLYSDNLRKLGVDTAAIDSMMIQEVEAPERTSLGTLKNPWQIVWSDKTDSDEKLFASIDKGEYYTDINGDVRIKN